MFVGNLSGITSAFGIQGTRSRSSADAQTVQQGPQDIADIQHAGRVSSGSGRGLVKLLAVTGVALSLAACASNPPMTSLGLPQVTQGAVAVSTLAPGTYKVTHDAGHAKVKGADQSWDQCQFVTPNGTYTVTEMNSKGPADKPDATWSNRSITTPANQEFTISQTGAPRDWSKDLNPSERVSLDGKGVLAQINGQCASTQNGGDHSEFQVIVR